MIKRSNFELKSHVRKKLTIVDSRSSIFKNNLKNTNQPEGKNKLSLTNKSTNKSRQNDHKHKPNDLPSIGKENLHQKNRISLKKSSLNSEEKGRVTSIIQLLMGHRRQSTLPNLCGTEKSTIDKKISKLRVGNISPIADNEFYVVNYSLSSLLKTQKTKPKFESFNQMTSFEYEKQTVSPETSVVRKMAPPKKSNYSQKTEINQQQKSQGISNLNQFRIVKKKEIYKNQNFKKSKYLKLESSLFQIIIAPSNPKNGKISVEIQTVQDEKEYFDYLRFKRKRTILQQELVQAFSIVSVIKGDRAVYEERVSRFLGFDSNKPSNDRQERVFKLKDEILKLGQNVEDIILEKYRAFDDYITELEKIEDSFLAQNQKFIKSIHKYKEAYAISLQPVDNQKINNFFTKVQNGVKKHFHESQKKLYDQILKGKTYNDQASELIQVFRDYNKTIKEQKILLRNCFGHIKKIPELCYGLLGDQLPDLTLKKQNDVFILPKCMQCFNSEWKMHVIVEKNQLMQSILKVTDELLK